MTAGCHPTQQTKRQVPRLSGLANTYPQREMYMKHIPNMQTYMLKYTHGKNIYTVCAHTYTYSCIMHVYINTQNNTYIKYIPTPIHPHAYIQIHTFNADIQKFLSDRFLYTPTPTCLLLHTQSFNNVSIPISVLSFSLHVFIFFPFFRSHSL